MRRNKRMEDKTQSTLTQKEKRRGEGQKERRGGGKDSRGRGRERGNARKKGEKKEVQLMSKSPPGTILLICDPFQVLIQTMIPQRWELPW